MDQPADTSRPPHADAADAPPAWRRRFRLSLGTKATLVVAAFGMVMALSIGALVFRAGAAAVAEIERLSVADAVGRVTSRLKSAIDQLRGDALILSRTPPLEGLHNARSSGGGRLDGPATALWRDRMAQIFTSFMADRETYFQVRLLDGAGMEIVRVERTDGGIARVPQAALQDKSDRAYFRSAAAIEPGQVYLSDFDLNRENGEIEVPHRPTIRSATPVRFAGSLSAVVVINAEADPLFGSVASVLPATQRLFVANGAGELVFGPAGSDRGRAYSFEFGERDRPEGGPAAFGGGDAESLGGFGDGETELFARRVAFDPDRADRFVHVAVLSSDSEFARLTGWRSASVAAAAAVLLTGGAALAWMLSSVILGALRSVTAAARAIQGGARDVDLSGLARRSDETGDLARAFADMAEEIRDRETELVERSALEDAYTALSARNTLLSAVMETALDGLIVIDGAGTVHSFNPAASGMFGYAPDEVIGNNVSMLMPEPHRTRHNNYLDRFFKTGEARMIGAGREVRALKKDGTEITIELGVSAMQVGDRRLFLGMTTDISRRKLVERQKEEQFVSELRRSNEELAQFAYVASHDLQEPLRAVGAYVELLARRYRGRLDGEADEFIDYAVDGVARMKAMINDILGYSRVSQKPIAAELVDTEVVVDAIAAAHAGPLAETGGRIERSDLPPVLADPGQVERLFRNLIDNAIKYRAPDRSPEITIGGQRRGDRVVFTIADNGIGIDPKFKEKVFGIFTRLHSREQYSGTGVGLAACRRIVERHGGEITVEPAENLGSVFMFSLPAEATTENDVAIHAA